MNRIADLVPRFEGRRVVVLGDLAVDCFVETEPERLSHEAPVMVLRYRKHRYLPGCAANTVMNLRRLGAEVIPIGIVGEDEPGRALLEQFADADIPDTGLVYSGTSVLKVRLMSGEASHVQRQLVRVDVDMDGPFEEDAMLELIARAGAAEGAEAIVVSDYNYGAASPGLLRAVQGVAPDAMVAVDSRERVGDFERVTLLAPNAWKAADYLALPIESAEQGAHAAGILRKRSGAEAVILTLGHRGMILADGEFEHLPARNHIEIVDPTGAGDTVIAVATMARLAGASWRQAAELANHAAALAVARRGAGGPSAEELREAVAGG